VGPSSVGANAFSVLTSYYSRPLVDILTKKLTYRRGTARRSKSVEILSTAAHLHTKRRTRSGLQ